ncbi:K(+)-transporting ATPase subunit F [Paenibacillus donghaensis]|uniref:K(+)-transporting ATPase subunit F n=1 Tax=Paenibacillus donghaensis TaxID=414771 RepID=A0A2Z2KED5_9BACL|nr:K(+)-transporting ATPase subunit F [Paenibacillus donghaensis]
MVWACGRRCRGEWTVTVVMIATLLLFLYLVYALIHPEKF